eukprot:jgi/Chrzof1/2548/Cz11g19210.t1
MSRQARVDDDYEDDYGDDYPEARTTTRKRAWRAYDDDSYSGGAVAARAVSAAGGGQGGIFKTAAIEVLNQEKRLMATGEITRIALERKLLACQGKTPDATMASALYTDVRKRGGSSPFIKPKQGLFGLKSWLDEPWLQDWLSKEGIELADFLPDENADSYGGSERKSARKSGSKDSSYRTSSRNTARVNYAQYENAYEEEDDGGDGYNGGSYQPSYAARTSHASHGGGHNASHTAAYNAAYRQANDIGNLAYQNSYAASAAAGRTAAPKTTTAAATTTTGGAYNYGSAGRQPLALPNNIYANANLPAALYNMQNLQAAAALAAVAQSRPGGVSSGTASGNTLPTSRGQIYYQ